MQGHPLISIETWFERFVDGFRTRAGEKKLFLDRKVRHIKRVRAHVQEIGKECEWSRNMALAMDVAALLHDVGRFPQLVERKTYDDTLGYNHAEEGARLLAQADVLSVLPDSLRDRILCAISFHNCAILPGGLEPDSRLILDVLRDADKLDAVRNNLRYLSPDAPHNTVLKSGLLWDAQHVSPLVLELCFKRQLIPFNQIRWSNDFILFLCCWVYDLHFPYSFKQLRESGHFASLLERLPNNADLMPIKRQLASDLDWMAAQSRS